MPTTLRAVTRDYVFDIDARRRGPPLLSVFGGKITTYRKLAEHALDKLRPFFPEMGAAWTARRRCPAATCRMRISTHFFGDFQRAHGWLPADLAQHYARLYGTRADALLGGAAIAR